MANNKILVFDPKKEEEFFEQIKKMESCLGFASENIGRV